MKKTQIKVCGVPESASLRRAVSATKEDAARSALLKAALSCPEGAAREIIVQLKREHREATEPDRALVRKVRDRGGVCFPGWMSAEDWRNKLPRSLHGKRSGCARADELAQELYDRGAIPEPSTDAVLDHLDRTYARAKSEPSMPDKADLEREAKRIVRQRVTRAVRELVATARREAQAVCPVPEKREPGMEG